MLAVRKREQLTVADEPQTVDRYEQRWAGPGSGEPEEWWAVARQREEQRQAQRAWAQMEQKSAVQKEPELQEAS